VWEGLCSDPEGKAQEYKHKNHYPKHALPARIAAGVCCRSFYAERIFSLELLFLLVQAKRKNQLFLKNITPKDPNLEILGFNMLLINVEFLLWGQVALNRICILRKARKDKNKDHQD
jgi:hypothetical protein